MRNARARLLYPRRCRTVARARRRYRSTPSLHSRTRLSRAPQYEYRHALAAGGTGRPDSPRRRDRRLRARVDGEPRGALVLRYRGTPRTPLLERRCAARSDPKSRQTYLLGAPLRPSDDLSGNASLRLGPARNGAALDRAGSADLGRSSRYAAHAGGAARSSGHVCRTAFGRRKTLGTAARRADGSARFDLARSANDAVFALTAPGIADESQLRRPRASTKERKTAVREHQQIGRILARRRGRLRFGADCASNPSGSDARGTVDRARTRPLVALAKRG